MHEFSSVPRGETFSSFLWSPSELLAVLGSSMEPYGSSLAELWNKGGF